MSSGDGIYTTFQQKIVKNWLEKFGGEKFEGHIFVIPDFKNPDGWMSYESVCWNNKYPVTQLF